MRSGADRGGATLGSSRGIGVPKRFQWPIVVLGVVLFVLGDPAPIWNPPAARAADPPTDKVLILVADLDPPQNTLTEAFLGQLRKAAPGDAQIEVQRLGRAITEEQGEKAARALGEEKTAGLVVWGQPSKAGDEALHSKAIELGADDLPLRMNRGGAYASKGNFDRAIDDFSRAIELAPDDINAYNARGTVYASKLDLDSAIADFTESIRRRPESHLAYCLRGAAFGAKNDIEQALIDFDRAIELAPKSAECFMGRGYAHRQRGDKEKALADFRRALELSEIPAQREEIEKAIQDTE